MQHSLNLNFKLSAHLYVFGLNMDFNEWNPFWATCYSVMAFLIIVGNSLTIATLLRKKFRKRPQFLLISLAFADLLVGCATTLYVIVEYRLLTLSFAFNLLDQGMFARRHSSVFHLAVISLQRLNATRRSFRHRHLSLKVYWVTIVVPWIFSLCFTISIFMLRTLTFLKRSNVAFFIMALLTSPLLLTCCSYFAIWKKRRTSRDKVRSFRQSQEARFSKTIFLVIAASFISCLPFQLCYIVRNLWPTTLIPLSVIFVTDLLQFSNSFVNFAIYFLRFPSYRKALFSSVFCKVPKHETATTSLPSYEKPRSSRALES